MARRKTAELKVAREGLVRALAAHAEEEQLRFVKAPDRIKPNAEVVRNYLKSIDFRFFETEEENAVIFHGSICGEGDVVDTYCWRIHVAHSDVQSFFNFPGHVPIRRRAAMAEFLAFANWGLRYGKFSMDIADDGELAFHMTVPAAVLSGDPNVEVDRLIGLPLAMLERYAQGVIDVLQGRSPKAAYEECERRQTLANEGECSLAGRVEEPPPSPECTESQKVEQLIPGEVRNGEWERFPGDQHKEQAEGDMHDAPVLARDYSLDGLNVKGDVPLEKLVDAVCRFHETNATSENAPRLNILLSGPSGCGKTEFVKYLGQKAGAEVITVAASDVLDPMVGRTEQKLAKLFARAKRTKSILFLDEVDSLLGSRKMAEHNWECVQTNELLQQMEKFGGILVGATNFDARLDPAVGRRFTFKLKMDFLSEDGKIKFFDRYFKTPLTESEKRRLMGINSLTPGDFRTVRERLYFLSKNETNAERLAALEAESETKERTHAKIGF